MATRAVTVKDDGKGNKETVDDNVFIQIETPSTKVGGPNTSSNEMKEKVARDNPHGVTLRWENINFSVMMKNEVSKQMEEKKILKSITGEAKPGELLVIMGPSGAGKSSLMDCLAGRNTMYTGHVSINGATWSSHMNRLSSYVQQDDLFYETLTVEEHLMFQAELRMGNNYTIEEKTERVTVLLEELGLTKCRKTKIGGARFRGISGGERKRLSFCTELLTNPSLIYADEPTSGLDSFMAETVMVQLRQLAHKGRTVIATIHQPSSELFALFDKLLLLADGSVIYHGPGSKSVEYFGERGYNCPSYSNPADYFLRLLAGVDEQSKKRVDHLIVEWSQHASTLKISEQAQNEQKELDELYDNSEALGLFRQLDVISRRNVTRLLRDGLQFKARVAQTLILSILVGLIYFQIDEGQSAVQNFSGALFFTIVNQVFGPATAEFVSVPLELPILLREHSTGLYCTPVWFLSKNLSEAVFQLFFPLLFIVPLYFMIGFDINAELFFTMALIYILVSSSAVGLGYMVSCLTKRAEIASIVGPVIILPLLLFGGLFLNADDAPVYLIWLQYLSPIKYGYEAIMLTFWRREDTISCNNVKEEDCRFKTGDSVLEYYKFQDGSVTQNCLILFALNVGFRLVAMLSLMALTSKKNGRPIKDKKN